MKGITQNMHDGWFWPGRVRWGSRIRVMNLKGSFAPTRLTWWNSLGGDISSLLVSSAFKWQCGIDCPGLNWSTCFFITYGDIVLSYYQYMYTFKYRRMKHWRYFPPSTDFSTILRNIQCYSVLLKLNKMIHSENCFFRGVLFTYTLCSIYIYIGNCCMWKCCHLLFYESHHSS